MLEFNSVSKYIDENDQRTFILRDISLKVDDGEFISLVGKSGSGKSSLLYLMGTLDKPSLGEIKFKNKLVDFRNEKQIHEIRKNELGFIFQFHYLIDELTVLDNVLLPTTANGPSKRFLDRAEFLLNEMGLEGKFKRKPHQLSGGERQRVAIARALIRKPKLILADEPTGNLDSINSLNVMNILKRIHQEEKTTIVLVTHDVEYAEWGSRKIQIADGKVISD